MHAEWLDRPLNTLATVHWRLADGDTSPEAVLRRAAKVRELMRHWLARRCGGAWFVWVFENSHADSLHWHLLAHVPSGKRAAFERMLRDNWVGDGAPAHIDVRPADGNAIKYLCKDAPLDDWLAAGFDLPLWRKWKHKRSVAPFPGKRVGIAQALGLKARLGVKETLIGNPIPLRAVA